METAAPHLGPGTYEPGNVTRTGAKLDYLSRPGAGAVSAFKNSVGHELILLGNMEAPPSTSYDLGDLWDRRSLSRGAASRRGTSSFGTGGGRGGASVGSMAPTLDTLLFGAPAGGGKPDTGPGPGAYELQDFASIRAKLSREGARPSPPFQPHDSAPKRPYGGKQMLVSPSEKVAHDYLSPSHPPLHGHSPPHGISSPFRSRSAGHQEFVDERAYAASANAPGPAYYQPPAMLRKSHHKNATQHYTTVAS
ncbi:hypothetical protein HYH03_007304 [Edaphochlamys debaryana]|uniref:Uncharacterized protein n=1 Tax=Edaphochlamys debaryana TaxID=47281 RepID=A0A835Y0T4_9CHLO|nr:hypothetical protein HYH03_007304 [Edaphochlamys debaryana]|eukprot:KAG2494537.1 hypothetical protein HYH03_007304 [Edaphochlamys debaryana]